ncbi:1-phosphofructokinase family hexose kinase [Paenibacillus sp. GCM10012306]|uniref:1-phosphofructokinase family hexose kinase n=1 Tax=Paenibacillus sp. GCM10012306 TaxID=3317342 RepID=UPI00361DAAFE
MITTVTLNPAVDKIYTVPGFQINGVHRITDSLTLPGGKGVNAARVLSQLGAEVTACGFAAGYTGEQLLAGLAEEGVDADFVKVTQGETRLALTVLDSASTTQTELIESGPVITGEALSALRSRLEKLARRSRWVLLSGSLPPGCPPWLYAELADIAHHGGAQVMLDASGEALRLGLQGRPELVKPNEHEAAELAGLADTGSEDTARQALEALLELGARDAVVTLGPRGAVAAADGQRYRVTLPSVTAVSPLGSGDATAAGLLASAVAGGDWPARLTLGAACGTAAALQRAAGFVNPGDVAAIAAGVAVTVLSRG